MSVVLKLRAKLSRLYLIKNRFDGTKQLRTLLKRVVVNKTSYLQLNREARISQFHLSTAVQIYEFSYI